MDRAGYLIAIRHEGEALSRAAADLGARVPSCPDWSVADLVAHTGGVHRWVAEMVRTHADARLPRESLAAPPTGPAALAWFDEGLAELLEVLTAADPDAPVWNWSGVDLRAGWWPRRMAHETAVHRWDAESAAGIPSPIDAELAADGIDEVLTIHLPNDFAYNPDDTRHGTVHLHCTDTDGEWLVTLHPNGVDVRREHAKGDAALRGTASDLDLYCWGRATAQPVEILGNPTIAPLVRTG